MYVELIQGNRYMYAGTMFHRGAPKEVDEETGEALLEAENERGAPYFREVRDPNKKSAGKKKAAKKAAGKKTAAKKKSTRASRQTARQEETDSAEDADLEEDDEEIPDDVRDPDEDEEGAFDV